MAMIRVVLSSSSLEELLLLLLLPLLVTEEDATLIPATFPELNRLLRLFCWLVALALPSEKSVLTSICTSALE